MTPEALGDRMKMYEDDSRFIPLLPVVVRIDGKCFSSFTKKLKKPYDTRLISLMQDTTQHLVKTTGACIGYTQSDEITLIFYSPNYRSQIFLDGRKKKMISVLASRTTGFFNHHLGRVIPEKVNEFAEFDARADAYPTKEEAVNCLIWREMDARRNSISIAARSIMSHKEMDSKNSSELMEILFQNGINWDDYPTHFKRGSYYQRSELTRTFTTDELEKLPLKHEARENPELTYTRHDVFALEMPPITKVTNRVDVVFKGAAPVYFSNVVFGEDSVDE